MDRVRGSTARSPTTGRPVVRERTAGLRSRHPASCGNPPRPLHKSDLDRNMGGDQGTPPDRKLPLHQGVIPMAKRDVTCHITGSNGDALYENKRIEIAFAAAVV